MNNGTWAVVLTLLGAYLFAVLLNSMLKFYMRCTDTTRVCDWIDAHRSDLRWAFFYAASAALGWFGEAWRLAHGFTPISAY